MKQTAVMRPARQSSTPTIVMARVASVRPLCAAHTADVRHRSAGRTHVPCHPHHSDAPTSSRHTMPASAATASPLPRELAALTCVTSTNGEGGGSSAVCAASATVATDIIGLCRGGGVVPRAGDNGAASASTAIAAALAGAAATSGIVDASDVVDSSVAAAAAANEDLVTAAATAAMISASLTLRDVSSTSDDGGCGNAVEAACASACGPPVAAQSPATAPLLTMH